MLSKSLSIFFSIYFFLNQFFINFLITLFRMIYEPREDSDLLKKWVLKLVSGRVLDMGTGSGVQALAALETTTGGVEGNEILLEFLLRAKAHLNTNGKILIVISSLTGEAEELFTDYSWKELETQKLFFEELTVYELSLKEDLYFRK